MSESAVTPKQKLVGHKFEGTDIISERYTKKHYFPADVNTSTSYRDDSGEYTQRIRADVGPWRLDMFPNGFEIAVIEIGPDKKMYASVVRSIPVYEDVVEDTENGES